MAKKDYHVAPHDNGWAVSVRAPIGRHRYMTLSRTRSGLGNRPLGRRRPSWSSTAAMAPSVILTATGRDPHPPTDRKY
jgi:hypothetical protein